MKPEELPELRRVPRKLNRLTITTMLHHEQTGSPPSSISARMSVHLSAEEEPYQRRRTATTAWVPLELGWLEDESVSAVVIENLEDRDRSLRDLSQELSAGRQKALCVSYDENVSRSFFVYPGGFLPLFPSDAKALLVRAYSDEVVFRVNVFPA